MKSPFLFSDDNKRYHTYNYFLRHFFGEKVFKVSLNASMTCPNRDGTKGVGGCSYCSEALSGDFAGNPQENIKTQFDCIKNEMHKKWPDATYIAYFQSGTNTYAPLERLRELFEEAISFDGVRGLSVATRADCISEEVADYLGELAGRTFLTVELGLQTIHDKTSHALNRCHSFEEFLRGYELLKRRGINLCVHIIDGLPGESAEMMRETARAVSALHPQSVKIHLLHVLKGTPLEIEYQKGGFSVLDRDEYVKIICDQLELLPEDIVIARVTGDGAKEQLVAPRWSLKKFCVMNEIDKELLRRNSFQGIKAEKSKRLTGLGKSED